jgi:predicted TIM-barrel fold metal-dependent hydrolase
MSSASSGEFPRASHGVIDACAFHEWNSSEDLFPYLSRGWRDLLSLPGSGMSTMSVVPGRSYQNPTGGKAENSYPPTGKPGSDFEFVTRQLFESGSRERAVLAYDEGFFVTAFGHVQASIAFTRAVNDWNLEHWLSRDDRLYGLVLVSSQAPQAAAKELRRVGHERKIVGVALGANSMGRMYGHPAYHPIYEAAVELKLPVVIQIGTEAATSSILPPVGGGMPATFSEYWALRMHGTMSHVASMITEGIFGLFPDLKLLLVGCGATWVPQYLWRLNYNLKRHPEMPWITTLTSDIFKEHVRIATNSLERPKRREQLVNALTTLPWVDSVLMYASGYPNVEYEEPEDQAKRLPEVWHPQLFRDNALRFFRWPDAGPDSAADIETAGQAALAGRIGSSG